MKLNKTIWIVYLLAGLAVTGCGSRSNFDSAIYADSYMPEDGTSSYGVSKATAEVGRSASLNSSESSSLVEDVVAVEAEPVYKAKAEEEVSQSGINTKLIRTVNIQFSTDKSTLDVANEFTAKAEQYGGYVTDSNYNEYATYENSTLTIRVPAEDADAYLSSIKNTDIKVEELKDSSQDVSLEYVDLETSLKILRAKKEKWEARLQEASTLEEIVTVEDALTQIDIQLNQSESRMRYLNNKVTYTTIGIQVKRYTYDRETFTGTMATTWSDANKELINGLSSLVSVYPYFVTFLLGVLIYGGLLVASLILLGKAFKFIFFRHNKLNSKNEKWTLRAKFKNEETEKESDNNKAN